MCAKTHKNCHFFFGWSILISFMHYCYLRKNVSLKNFTNRWNLRDNIISHIFATLAYQLIKGHLFWKNNMPDTSNSISYLVPKGKISKNIRAWCRLQNGNTWSQIVENSVEIWFNNIMFFAKVSTPTISWSKKLFEFFENDRIEDRHMCYKSWSFLENSDNPLYAHTLIIKKGKCNAGFLNA